MRMRENFVVQLISAHAHSGYDQLATRTKRAAQQDPAVAGRYGQAMMTLNNTPQQVSGVRFR